MTDRLPVIVRLPAAVPGSAPDTVAVAREALAISARHRVEAVLIPHEEPPALDPSVLGGLLSSAGLDVPVIIEAHTGRHAPFNLARRVQTLARITAGRAAVYLRDSGVDPVTAAGRPAAAADAEGLIDEYALLLRRLWNSFPESALLGDREAARFVDVAQLAPAQHEGRRYGVAGALNVPIAPAQRPVLLADAGSLGEVGAVDAVVSAAHAVLGPPAYRPITWAADADAESTRRSLADALAQHAGVLLRIDAPASAAARHLEAALSAITALASAESEPLRPSPWQRRSPGPSAA